MELLDGVQRLSSIKSFVDNKLILSELEELDALNGFEFNDLDTARKTKILKYYTETIHYKSKYRRRYSR